MNSVYEFLFEFLRRAAGLEANANYAPVNLSADEWRKIYEEAKRQSVLDVVFDAVSKLPKEELPPKSLLMCWAAHAEATKDMNKRINKEAARLTEIFSKEGRRTAVLKGAANARLYPNPFSRQCGDIDLWIEGGRKSVEKLLLDLNLQPEFEGNLSSHHVHLPVNADGIVVEAHFKPASGIQFKYGAFQKYLNKEIVNAELVPEGFYAPSIKFALVMQLSHLQQHFLTVGVGMRHYMDYFILLQHSSESDRKEAAAVIKSLYMGKACSAVMWVLNEIFGLKPELMLCAPDEWRGKWLLKHAVENGNFGKHALNRPKYRNFFDRWFHERLNRLRWLPFDPINVIFKELKYWRDTISSIPLRIKRRRISLRSSL
jgi:hypothetical protein